MQAQRWRMPCARTIRNPGTKFNVSKERKASQFRKNDVSLELAPVLGASQGMQLHARLNPLVDESGSVTIDAGKVERVETLALQVLISFLNTRVSAGRAVEWSAVSSEFRRATDLLGLSEALRLPS